MFVRAIYYREQKTVHYFYENGKETLYIGGSFAWRTNNPGNMAKPGQRIVSTGIGFAQRIEKVKTLFLIFPDKETGDAERLRLLKEVYGKNSISEMMERYAPRKDHNDPVAYTDFITKETGIPSTGVVGQLSESQFKALAAAMQKKEGYAPGKIVELGKPTQITLHDKLRQPLAEQKIQIKSAEKSVELKTDEYGALPPMYSALLGDDFDLFHIQSSYESEKIGNISSDGIAPAYMFSAPYFLSKSTPHVHEIDEPLAPKIHIVQKGEILSVIASKYGFSVESFVKENSLKNGNTIFARQHLRIPSKTEGDGSIAGTVHTHAPSSPPIATQEGPAPTATTPHSTAATATPSPPHAALPQVATSSHAPAPTKQALHAAEQQAPTTRQAPHAVARPAPNARPVSGSAMNRPSSNSAAVAVDHQRNDNNHPVTVLSSAALELSGVQWCSRFMGSHRLEDLNDNFRPGAIAFYNAMRAVGIGVSIGPTFRPIERSYLMFHAFNIAKGASVTAVGPWAGVNIDWAHRGPDGTPNLAAAKAAAVAMCGGYGLHIHSKKQKVAAPKFSRHNKAAAVDMNISNFVGKTIKDNLGNMVHLRNFNDLAFVGHSYGVNYFPLEDMHWSDKGT